MAAAVALLVGTGALGERYAATTWMGALVILVGIALSVLAEQRRTRVAAASSAMAVPVAVAARRADGD